MASHIEIGKAGEKLAEAWLVDNGFTIIGHNWRCGKDEIDLIAIKNDMLHFVEVKCRTSNYIGYPEEAVNKKKITVLLRGIEQYLFLHPQYTDFRLDILAITQIPGKEAVYFFIEDVTL